MLQWDKCLYVSAACMKVLFVASALHVPFIWRSQNKILGIGVSVSLFFKPFCVRVCVGGFALPSSVFCAGEELHYLFLQCKATTGRDLTLKVTRFIIVTINTAYPRDTQFDAYMCLKTCVV